MIPGFVGFGSTATFELSYVPAVHGAEDIDSLVDADFRMVLRKLSKKDVVTRLKVSVDLNVEASVAVLVHLSVYFLLLFISPGCAGLWIHVSRKRSRRG